MCDDLTERDNQNFFAQKLTRRGFNLAAGSTAIGLAFAGCAAGEPLEGIIENSVMIDTPDGICDAYFVHPSKGKHAAVLVWPDILSVRPAFKMMAKRLAKEGYAVLVINPYYRMAKAPVVEVGETFSLPEVRERVLPLYRARSQENVIKDAKAFVNWLDMQDAVDTSRKIGTTGYCMGGPMTMLTAAHLPVRVGAGASFHGGGLATDKPDSPHLLVPQMKADFLIAIADNDDERDPEAKNLLRAAFDATDNEAEIEVYEGAMHGWCPPDSPVYDEVAAEKAWARKLALFERMLA